MGRLPLDKKSQIRDMLLTGHSIEETASRARVPLNSVRGVLSTLKGARFESQPGNPNPEFWTPPNYQAIPDPPVPPNTAYPQNAPPFRAPWIAFSSQAKQDLDEWCRENLAWGETYSDAVLRLLEAYNHRGRGRPKQVKN